MLIFGITRYKRYLKGVIPNTGWAIHSTQLWILPVFKVNIYYVG